MILPLLVILRSAATKDLGLESGKTKSENQHRDPSGGEAALRMTALFVILSAAVCHPEAGTIAEGSRPCLCLSSRANAIAQHPRRGVILTLPLLVILRSAATKDLGLESGPNHKRDPSAMEPPSGFLSKIKPERGQEGCGCAGTSPGIIRGRCIPTSKKVFYLVVLSYNLHIRFVQICLKKRKRMAFGRKVTIFLSDGAPSGIRHVEIANWSGQAIACPRSRLNELRNLVEAQRPGVYFLLEKQTAETGDRNSDRSPPEFMFRLSN